LKVAANTIWATGRRKNAIARVKMKKGTGKISINKRPVDDYFSRKTLQRVIYQPLEVTDNMGKFDFQINASGGGASGQSGAIRHGIARALCKFDENNRSTLKKNGYLTRDPRMVERKKYGKHGARKSTQFSKR
jgi:small subunit ribosomal protein S9